MPHIRIALHWNGCEGRGSRYRIKKKDGVRPPFIIVGVVDYALLLQHTCLTAAMPEVNRLSPVDTAHM